MPYSDPKAINIFNLCRLGLVHALTEKMWTSPVFGRDYRMPTQAELMRDYDNMVKLLTCPPHATYNWLSTFIDKSRLLELRTEMNLTTPSRLVRLQPNPDTDTSPASTPSS
jgi:hypothetical protein